MSRPSINILTMPPTPLDPLKSLPFINQGDLGLMSIFKDFPGSPFKEPTLNSSPLITPLGYVSLKISICVCGGTF